MKSSRSFWFD